MEVEVIMTPNEQANSTAKALGVARSASIICLLAGIWFFVSAWVYGAPANGNAWNCWIVGGVMIILSIVRVVRPAYSTGFSWVNTVLGIWTFFSPWIYGYTGNTGRFINSMCIGVVVFVFSIIAGTITRRRNALAAAGPVGTSQPSTR